MRKTGKKMLGLLVALVMAASPVPVQPVCAVSEKYEEIENSIGKQYKVPETVGGSITLTVGCASTDENMHF